MVLACDKVYTDPTPDKTTDPKEEQKPEEPQEEDHTERKLEGTSLTGQTKIGRAHV